ncbi:MAG: NAD(P)H-hydrate epimerase [Anaerolineae bacterium]
MKVSTISEMRALDRKAIEEFGIAAEILMENAGQAVYFVILNEFGIKDKRFLVICGLGNNGGDGLVVARKLHSSGGLVKVLLLGDPDRFQGAARANFEVISRLPIEVGQPESVQAVEKELTWCDAVVDAMLGTGISGAVRGLYRDVIEATNRSTKTVFSVDIPSGVHGDTGTVMGAAVRADYTVTFGLPKIGNVLLPGRDLCGKLYVSHISFPSSMTEATSLRTEINSPVRIPSGKERAHAEDFRRALFLCGVPPRHGNSELAALAYLEAGGQKPALAAPRSFTTALSTGETNAAVLPQTETKRGGIALENKEDLLEIARQMGIVGVGPGLSLELETQRLIRELAAEIQAPLLVAGDAVKAMDDDPEIIRGRKEETILICDAGELADLTKSTEEEINGDPVDTLRRTCGELRATVVLTGEQAILGYPDGHVFINMSGASGRTSADSAAILTGTIAALFGLGLPLRDAVRDGVFIYGLCVDLATEDSSGDIVTAGDILGYLSKAVGKVRDELDRQPENWYTGLHLV